MIRFGSKMQNRFYECNKNCFYYSRITNGEQLKSACAWYMCKQFLERDCITFGVMKLFLIFFQINEHESTKFTSTSA